MLADDSGPCIIVAVRAWSGVVLEPLNRLSLQMQKERRGNDRLTFGSESASLNCNNNVELGDTDARCSPINMFSLKAHHDKVAWTMDDTMQGASLGPDHSWTLVLPYLPYIYMKAVCNEGFPNASRGGLHQQFRLMFC